MSTAVAVIFHNNALRYKNNFRVLYEYWLKSFHLYEHLIDKVYIVDSNDSLIDVNFPDKAEVIRTGTSKAHIDNFNILLNTFSENKILFMDQDTIIYDPLYVIKVQELLENFQLASFTEREDWGIRRFAPCFMAFSSQFYRNLSKNYDPQNSQPLDDMTKEVISKNIPFTELYDERGGVTLHPVDGIVHTDNYKVTGIYHLRNFTGGINIIDAYHLDKLLYKNFIDAIPHTEFSRLLGLLAVANYSTIDNEELYDDIEKVVVDKGFKAVDWYTYLLELEDYHPFIRVLNR